MVTKRQFVMTIIIILVVNVLFILGIIQFFRSHYSTTDAAVPVVEENTEVAENNVYEEIVEEEVADPIEEVDFEALRNEQDPSISLKSIYTNILPGKYILGDEKVFIFYNDGNYEGYFDEEHNNIVGYSYELINTTEDICSVVISTPNGINSVVYNLDMNLNGSVLLRNPETEEHEVLFTLAKDGIAYEGDEPESDNNETVEEQ